MFKQKMFQKGEKEKGKRFSFFKKKYETRFLRLKKATLSISMKMYEKGPMLRHAIKQFLNLGAQEIH